MTQKVKIEIKFLSKTIFIFLIIIFNSNGQNLYSLNNFNNFIPSASANISLYEFPFLIDSSDINRNWNSSLEFTPSTLGYSQIKQFSGKLISTYLPNATSSFGINYYGFDLFNEFAANLSYAYNFNKLYLGLNFNYNRISVKDFGKDDLYKIDLFGKIKLNNNFNIGFFINNLNRAHFSSYDKTIHQNLIISLGINQFNLDNGGKLKMAADLGSNLDINSHSYFFTSLMFNINDFVWINTKIISKPIILYSGISLSLTDWMKLTAFVRFQKDFNFDQTFITEFNW